MSRFTNPVPQFFLDNGELASSGRMYFYENKNYSSLKTTYYQPDNTVANANPLILDGQGRLPPCFGEGLYSVKLYAANPDNPNIDGELIWTRDDVDLSAGGDSAFSAWSPVQTYGTGSIVKDGEPYYRLYGSSSSKGEQPSLNPSKWEKIVFITEHILGRSYPDEYIVVKSGLLYASNVNGNTTTPPSASWDNLTFNNSIVGNFDVSGVLTSGSVSTGIIAATGAISTPSSMTAGSYAGGGIAFFSATNKSSYTFNGGGTICNDVFIDLYVCGQVVFYNIRASMVSGAGGTFASSAIIPVGQRPVSIQLAVMAQVATSTAFVQFNTDGTVTIARNTGTVTGNNYGSGFYIKA